MTRRGTSLAIIAASVFAISSEETDRQTAVKPSDATTVDMGKY